MSSLSEVAFFASKPPIRKPVLLPMLPSMISEPARLTPVPEDSDSKSVSFIGPTWGNFMDNCDNIEPDVGFNLANQHLILTYPSLLDKDELIMHIEGVIRLQCKNFGSKGFCRAAHEEGKTGYEHTHVYLDCGSRFQSKSCRIFDFQGLHPNIGRCKTKSHQMNAKRYLSKVDPENADLADADQTIYDRYTGYSTIGQALGSVTNLNQVSGALQMYKYASKRILECKVDKFRGWQTVLFSETEAMTDDTRKIIHLYDPAGGSGKTFFQKHCMRWNPQKYFCTTALGSAKDAATVIMGALNSGWSGDTFMLNLTRSNEENLGLYNYIEQIRDGFMTATKYEGGTVDFDCYHFIIFANWLPDVDRLTCDRWDIRELRYPISFRGGLPTPPEMMPLNINEARRKWQEQNTYEMSEDEEKEISRPARK